MMEDEYPDPDEEFELMHADEFDLMDEFENDYPPVSAPITKAKRSLDFAKVPPSGSESAPERESGKSSKDDQSDVPESPLLQMPKTPVASENSKARTPFSEKKESNTKTSEEETYQRTPVSRNKKSVENISNKAKQKNESNKRSIDDLFGDIADIELEELLSGAKRSKTDVVLSEDERQEMMIAKIVAERKRQQVLKLRSLSSDPNDLTARCKDSVSMTRKVPKWPFFPVTDKKGLRLYARLYSDDHIKCQADSFAAATNSNISLSRSFVTTLDAAKKLLEKKFESPEPEVTITSVREAKKKSVKEHTTDLWVEKYKPRSYLELLSDEGTNRIVLQWLKLWDKVVFNKENKFIRKPNQQSNQQEAFVKKNVPVLDEELDENDCPKTKIALLCGPPGLGKTTLAHLLARHAGYNSVEVNASDDRSPELFQRKLETATQMQSVMGKSPRPNCLILDEIDGAPAPSINFLIKFASGKSTGKGKGKKTEQKQTLKRPIICICNNIYAPALRPLRQAALVIHFPETSSARLAQRLVEIARKERITTDLSAMMALSQKTNNDIRSCLSTLYCYQDQPVKLALIQRLNIGQKDMQKGFFSVWQDIFQIMKPQSSSYLAVEKSVNSSGASIGKTTGNSFKNRMCHVLSSVQGCGDYDKLVQGVFENYLNMNLKDSFFLNISEGLEWFCFYDIISKVIYSQQAFVLMPYIPYCFPVWHFLFSSYSYPKLTYPNVGHEATVKAAKTEQCIEDLLKGTPAYIRAYTCKKPLQLDILPLINVIINPNLRPVNIHLYSKREKEEFNKVVNTMIDYNLNFIQERALDGNFVWRMDPDINEVVKFDGCQQDGQVLNASLKQLISREIEMEKVRRLEIVSSAQRPVSTPSRKKGLASQQSPFTPSRQKTDSSQTPNTPKSGSEALPNHLQKLTPKAITKTFVNVPTKDFFGRVIMETEEETQKKKERKVDEIVKSEIWFHHKEGYNNAVRRPVLMKELM